MKLQTFVYRQDRFLSKGSEMKTGKSELSIVLKVGGTKSICFIELPINLD